MDTGESPNERENRVVMTIDNVDPRDPAGSCDRCGRLGTIARAVRHTSPPQVTRYCGACWPDAQAELEAQRDAERTEHRAAWRHWVEASRRDRSAPATRPSPPPAFTSTSRSWHDTRRFLEHFTPEAASGVPLDAASKVAKEIRRQAPEMDGPIPPDILAFVDTYDPPAT